MKNRRHFIRYTFNPGTKAYLTNSQGVNQGIHLLNISSGGGCFESETPLLKNTFDLFSFNWEGDLFLNLPLHILESYPSEKTGLWVHRASFVKFSEKPDEGIDKKTEDMLCRKINQQLGQQRREARMGVYGVNR